MPLVLTLASIAFVVRFALARNCLANRLFFFSFRDRILASAYPNLGCLWMFVGKQICGKTHILLQVFVDVCGKTNIIIYKSETPEQPNIFKDLQYQERLYQTI